MRARMQKIVERALQRRAGCRHLLHHRIPRAQCALGRVEITRLAKQMPEPQQRTRSDAVAGRNRFVRERLRPLDQRFVIVRGKPEAAAFAILEAFDQCVRECGRPC